MFTIVILILFLLLAAIVLPWINRRQIKQLRDDLNTLAATVAKLTTTATTEAPPTHTAVKPQPTLSPTRVHSITPTPWDEVYMDQQAEITAATPTTPSSTVITAAHTSGSYPAIEHQVAIQLPVWIGGIALALSGLFLVKYSLEKQLFSPSSRLCLSAMLGMLLLVVADKIRQKSKRTHSMRIAQSLTGAGIVIFYAVCFAANSLYQLVPVWLSVIGMASTTFLAILLSLRHGVPIALLALLGGFLTPAMVSTTPVVLPLFLLYLYALFSGLMIVVKQRQWWWLGLLAIVAIYFWAGIYLLMYSAAANNLSFFLFLTGISCNIILSMRSSVTTQTSEVVSLTKTTVKFAGLSSALVMLAAMLQTTGFHSHDWLLFGCINAGALALAHYQPQQYSFIAWLSWLVTMAMLYVWHPTELLLFTQILAAFSALYVVTSYLRMYHAAFPLLWSQLWAASSLGFYLLAYYRLHNTALVAHIPLLWGGIALSIALLSMITILRIIDSNSHAKQGLLAILFSVMVAFITLAFTIELQRDFLLLLFATEALTIAWLNYRLSLPILRHLSLLLVVLFACLLAWQVFLVMQLRVDSLFIPVRHLLFPHIVIIQSPLSQLGLSGILLLATSYYLRLTNDDLQVRQVEYVALALLAASAYFVIRHLFHPDHHILLTSTGFLERGIINSALFAYGILCLLGGRYFNRAAMTRIGNCLFMLATFHCIYYDIYSNNPWTATTMPIIGWPIANALLINYGMPLLWLGLKDKLGFKLHSKRWLGLTAIVQLLLLFTLLNTQIRHLFHGAHLALGATSNAELYCYSAAWLLLGASIVFMGVLRQRPLLRYAGLLLIALTVAKVFLYDSSALQGLYRVFSFLGLGLSLLVLSYFYTQFVAGNKPPN